MLNDAELETLRTRYGKIGIIDYNGHQIVFRRPTRDNCRDYRRKIETEKSEAIEQLAQVTLVAFDGEQDANKARTIYTSVFLEEVPLFTSNTKVMAVLGALSGVVEEEEATDLGKGACVKSGPRNTTPTA